MIESLPPFKRGQHYEPTPSSGYWFRLKREITVDLGLPIYGKVSFLDAKGKAWARLDDDALTIAAGYSWDGATCTPNFQRTMLPSLIHDVLYQFLATEHMRPRIDKHSADLLFYHAMKLTGFILRGPYYQAVRQFGHLYLRDDNKTRSVLLP